LKAIRSKALHLRAPVSQEPAHISFNPARFFMES